MLPDITPAPAVTVEELADQLPWAASGVRVALETEDISGRGRWFLARLKEIISASEAQFEKWEMERKATRVESL